MVTMHAPGLRHFSLRLEADVKAETVARHLRERPHELRLVVYHDCQGEERPVVARLFALAWQPNDYACPLCGARPGLDGFTYEWCLDQDVPASVLRCLTDEVTL